MATYKTKVCWAEISDSDKWDILRALCDKFNLNYAEAMKALMRIETQRDKQKGENEGQEKNG